MNEAHLALCSSDRWAELVEREILPLALGDHALGDQVLEIGPGPGRSTDLLRRMVPMLTAVELDDELADALAARLRGTDVEVVHADARSMPFDDSRFSTAASFAMLHHVPSASAQDQLFAEVRRVLRPGGAFVGVDTVATPAMEELHQGDIYVPIDPEALPARLAAAGFVDVRVAPIEPGGYSGFRFHAEAPG